MTLTLTLSALCIFDRIVTSARTAWLGLVMRPIASIAFISLFCNAGCLVGLYLARTCLVGQRQLLVH